MMKSQSSLKYAFYQSMQGIKMILLQGKQICEWI